MNLARRLPENIVNTYKHTKREFVSWYIGFILSFGRRR